MGIILSIVAFVGVITLGLWGYAMTVLYYLLTLRLKELINYHMNIAIALDKLGNVLLGLEMNFLLIKRDSPEKFGNHKETISDNLGDNKKIGKFEPIGKGIADALDKIDPQHVEKASNNNN